MTTKEEILMKIEPLLNNYYSKLNKIDFIPEKSRVNIGWPMYDQKEVLKVLNSLLEMRISQGTGVLEFEKNFAEYMGVKHAIAVNSGSSANLLALLAFLDSGDAKVGEDVIIPAATFTTVASPIIQLGLRPVFVDVEEDTYNIDPKEIEKAITSKTKLLMPVHSLGNPANMLEIIKIANKYNLKILEDFCESHGSSINDKKVGSFSDMSTLSFFVAHNITTGEGGMVFTDNDRYNKLLRSLREFGRFNEDGFGRFDYKDEILGNYDTRYIFQRLGFNVRMTDLAASAGIEQLKKLDMLNNERINICNFYINSLKKYENWIQLPIPKKNTVHTYYGFLIVIKKIAPFSRNEITNFLESRNIETRPFFGGCLPDQPAFRNQNIKVIGELPVSRHLRDYAFFIGCHPGIGKKEREYVVNMIHSFFEKFK